MTGFTIAFSTIARYSKSMDVWLRSITALVVLSKLRRAYFQDLADIDEDA